MDLRDFVLFFRLLLLRMTKSVTLIKLGGAIITNKETPMSLRPEVLTRLVAEIVQARKDHPEELLIVGHGAGSFAHYPASKYQTMKGFINEESRYGMAVVQDVAAQLNRIVVGEFLKQHMAALTVAPSNTVLVSEGKSDHFCGEVCEEYLKHDLLPVTYGDVIADSKQGCTVWSTEQVLAFFAEHLLQDGWKVKQIIHVTEVEGFYDTEKQIVPKISADNWPQLKSALTTTKGFDVTGGMGLKVEESLKLATWGIRSKIISGLSPDRLYKTIIGEETPGTVIYA